MSDPVPPPAASPSPGYSGHDGGKTPASFLVTTTYVKAKLLETEKHIAQVADHAAREAARQEHNGKPRIPPFLTPYFFLGFLLSGAITSVVVGDPDSPKWVLKAAAIGTMFFGGALGIGPGWRRK